MLVLWCDDGANDPKKLDAFLSEWNLSRDSVLPAVSDEIAISLLRAHKDIGLLVVDLLWHSEPEHVAVVPTGVSFIERIRSKFPRLRIVTRSVIEKPDVLANLVPIFVRLGVSDHFVSHEPSTQAALRRRMALEVAEKELAQEPGVNEKLGLAAFVGANWGVAMFADVSGFTAMTEQLWFQNRELLCSAINKFYDMAMQKIVENGGIVDKFIGDEVMALFILPADSKSRGDICCRAVDAARGMLNQFRELERSFSAMIDEEPEAFREVRWMLKIGIESGAMMVMEKILPNGDREFCTIARAVNIASRVKSLAGDYGVALGPTLQRELPHKRLYETEEITDEVTLKGIEKGLKVYKLANR